MERTLTRTKNGKKQNELTFSGAMKSKSRSSLIGVEDVPTLSLDVVKPHQNLLAIVMSSMIVSSPRTDQLGQKTKPKANRLPY